MDAIQPTSVPFDSWASWVLVGNGPSATRRAIGPIIDAHDFVVRCNRYETRGWESQVGSRTTHWATHGLPWVSPEGSSKPMTPGEGAAPPKWGIFMHPKTKAPEGVHLEGQVSPPLGLMAELHTRLELGAGKMPSTGISTLFFLLRYWGVNRVHLVGMDGFSKESSKTHHYWDSRAFRRPDEHDGDAEMRLLRRWAAVGRVSFLS